MTRLTVTGPYTAKDQRKADLANKFIGRGSARSSTNSYARDFGEHANCGEYTAKDVVFISAEGNRGGRLTPDLTEIAKAIEARAMLVTDSPYDRMRPYNLGEREVCFYLSNNGYHEIRDGRWTPAT